MAVEISKEFFDGIARGANRLLEDYPGHQDLMVFGAAHLDQQAALERRLIQAPEDFRADVRQAKFGSMLICLEGNTYTDLELTFRQRGNRTSPHSWIGDARFSRGESYLEYGLRSFSTIEMNREVRRDPRSTPRERNIWHESAVADVCQATHLLRALRTVRERAGLPALREEKR